MRKKGKIRSWNDDKGFGFIAPSEGGKDVFLHISAFKNRNRRPETGQIVTYSLSCDNQGRYRANNATLPGDLLQIDRKKSGALGALITAGGFLAVLAIIVVTKDISPVILWLYLGASLIAYLAYAFDKVAAQDGAWRTSESTLHFLSLIGGWPGALIAQQFLRHKSKKQSFRLVFWITVILNIAALLWLLTPAGMDTFRSLVSQG